MNAPYDPVVADALGRIAPDVDADPELLLRRAKQARGPRRRSWLVRGGVLAFAGIVVAGGAAVAATKLDLVPWLKTKSNSNIRFSIDPHYRLLGLRALTVLRFTMPGRAATTWRIALTTGMAV